MALLSIRKIRILSWVLLACFALTSDNTAQAQALPYMPAAGKLISTSAHYNLPGLIGMRFDSDNPLEFTFILNSGNAPRQGDLLRREISQISKYFLAGLTIPENEWWVNLSPYESNRITSEALGQTDLGKDLLGEDYVLKQLAASLTYPESETGKAYWRQINNSVIASAAKQSQSFNKVWIIPDKIKTLEAKDRVVIKEATFKVLTEEDYLALQKNGVGANDRSPALNAFKTHILPLIEKEINHGKQFAQLRQIYSALILASWFKEKLKSTVLNSAYVDKKKLKGADVNDPAIREKIYNEYVKAFNQGVYNYVKSERVGANGRSPVQKISKRQYFSGGASLETTTDARKQGAQGVGPAAVDQALGDGSIQARLLAKPVVAAAQSRDEQAERSMVRARAEGAAQVIKQPLTVGLFDLVWQAHLHNPDGGYLVGEPDENGDFAESTFSSKTKLEKLDILLYGRPLEAQERANRVLKDRLHQGLKVRTGVDLTREQAMEFLKKGAAGRLMQGVSDIGRVNTHDLAYEILEQAVAQGGRIDLSYLSDITGSVGSNELFAKARQKIEAVADVRRSEVATDIRNIRYLADHKGIVDDILKDPAAARARLTPTAKDGTTLSLGSSTMVFLQDYFSYKVRQYLGNKPAPRAATPLVDRLLEQDFDSTVAYMQEEFGMNPDNARHFVAEAQAMLWVLHTPTANLHKGPDYLFDALKTGISRVFERNKVKHPENYASQILALWGRLAYATPGKDWDNAIEDFTKQIESSDLVDMEAIVDQTRKEAVDELESIAAWAIRSDSFDLSRIPMVSQSGLMRDWAKRVARLVTQSECSDKELQLIVDIVAEGLSLDGGRLTHESSEKLVDKFARQLSSGQALSRNALRTIVNRVFGLSSSTADDTYMRITFEHISAYESLNPKQKDEIIRKIADKLEYLDLNQDKATLMAKAQEARRQVNLAQAKPLAQIEPLTHQYRQALIWAHETGDHGDIGFPNDEGFYYNGTYGKRWLAVKVVVLLLGINPGVNADPLAILKEAGVDGSNDTTVRMLDQIMQYREGKSIKKWDGSRSGQECFSDLAKEYDLSTDLGAKAFCLAALKRARLINAATTLEEYSAEYLNKWKNIEAGVYNELLYQRARHLDTTGKTVLFTQPEIFELMRRGVVGNKPEDDIIDGGADLAAIKNSKNIVSDGGVKFSAQKTQSAFDGLAGLHLDLLDLKY